MLAVSCLMLAIAAGINDPYPVDIVLSQQVTDQARSYGLNYRVIVAVPPSWGEQGVVNARTNVRGEVLAITVSPILLDDMDRDGLTGMFAHELAHPRETCGLTYASFDEELACEHKADAQAARWVGKRTVLRGLCQLMASGWRWRYNTDVSMHIARIKLLHNRSDIK